MRVRSAERLGRVDKVELEELVESLETRWSKKNVDRLFLGEVVHLYES